MYVKNNLKRIRNSPKPERRKSLQEIADYCKVNISTIQRIETHQIKNPSYYLCLDIANCLLVDPPTIFPTLESDNDTKE